jgi:acyl-CoA synthetase (AMP-forming)/AMP-acid ligase II
MNAQAVLIRAGLARPGPPHRVFRQLAVLMRWGTTLAGTFRSAAVRDPGRLAVVDEEGSWTFAELDQRSTRLAHALRDTTASQPHVFSRQTHPGLHLGRVGLLCRNHHGMIEALIACGKLGVDVVLLNTGLGAEQLRAVAEEQELDLLIADEEFAGVPGLPRVDSESFDKLIDAAPDEALAPPSRPGRTIVLSSGTTGRPKGARRPPRPGLSSLVSILSRIPLRVHDTVLIEAPLFHTWGYAALQISAALRATIVLRRRFRPEETLRAVAEHDCTALFAVPVMAQRLLELPARPVGRGGSLRVVALSGSALPGGMATAFMDVYGDVLYNLYGSTEVS